MSESKSSVGPARVARLDAEEQRPSSHVRLNVIRIPEVLIVDDDASLGITMVRSLAARCRCTICAGNEGGLALSESKHFDALIVNVSLEDSSGFDVLRAGKARFPNIVAIVLSSSVDNERLATAHRLGAAYLLKPISNESLNAFADRAVKTTSALQIAIESWQNTYALTPSECEVLTLSAMGYDRAALPSLRNVKRSTIKMQVKTLLRKTMDSLESAASRLLRDAISRTP